LIQLGQGKRLLEFLAKEKIKSRSKFAKMIGVSSSSINEVIWCHKRIKENIEAKISHAFPDIDMDWLLTGKVTKILTIKNHSSEVKEPSEDYNKICPDCIEKDEEIERLKSEVDDWRNKYIDCLEKLAGSKKDVSSG
jgi:plasmid maintenance system antidote protein VapI